MRASHRDIVVRELAGMLLIVLCSPGDKRDGTKHVSCAVVSNHGKSKNALRFGEGKGNDI